MKNQQINVNRTQWVRFHGPKPNGSKTDRVVDTRDIDTLVIPEQTQWFQFFEIYSSTFESETGEQILLRSAEVGLSHIIYCGGWLYSLVEGEQMFSGFEYAKHEDGDATIFELWRTGLLPGATHVIMCTDCFLRPFREGTDMILRRSNMQAG